MHRAKTTSSSPWHCRQLSPVTLRHGTNASIAGARSTVGALLLAPPPPLCPGISVSLGCKLVALACCAHAWLVTIMTLLLCAGCTGLVRHTATLGAVLPYTDIHSPLTAHANLRSARRIGGRRYARGKRRCHIARRYYRRRLTPCTPLEPPTSPRRERRLLPSARRLPTPYAGHTVTVPSYVTEQAAPRTPRSPLPPPRGKRWPISSARCQPPLNAGGKSTATSSATRPLPRWHTFFRCAVVIVGVLFGVAGVHRWGEASNPGPLRDMMGQADDWWDDGLSGDEQQLASLLFATSATADAHALDAPHFAPETAAFSEEPQLEAEPGIPFDSQEVADLSTIVHTGAAPTAAFNAESKFCGHRPGFVYKLSALGLGYHRDGMAVPQSSHSPAGSPPHNGASRSATVRWPLMLDALIGGNDQLPTAGSPPEPRSDGQPRGPRKRPRRRGHGMTAQQIRAAAAALPDTCAADDESHKPLGLWAIDSVNANAWAGALSYLELTAADVVAHQETRRTTEQCPAAERAATHRHWKTSLAACAVTSALRNSSGVGVSARAHLGMARLNGNTRDQALGGTDVGRIHCRWVGGMCRGGLHVVSVYLWTAEGLSKRNLDLLHELAFILRSISGPWVIAADWNMDPALLSMSGWPALVNGTIVAPTEATCGSNVLDFFVVSDGLTHAVTSVAVVEGSGVKPHAPVRLYVHAAPRDLLLRKLKTPSKIAGSLPHGCLQESASAPAASTGLSTVGLDDAYSEWLTDAETIWCDISGLSPSQQKRHSGRARGANFAWKPALGEVGSQFRDASAPSRAWRALASTCNSLRLYAACVTDDANATRLARTATRARARLRAQLTSPPPQLAALGGYASACNQVLCADPLDGALFKDLEAAFVSAAEAAERSMAVRRRLEWTAHLHKGSAGGMRNQHRFTRTASGWAPTSAASAPRPKLCTLDNFGDTPMADILRLLTPSTVPAPLNAQDEVEVEAAAWARQWAAGANQPAIHWPSDLGPMPPRPTPSQLRLAAASFPEATGLGWDALHPRAVCRLPDERIEDLITVLMKAEDEGRWPSAVSLVTIVLLAKDGGGFRPIGLFPMTIRLWMRLRRDMVVEWERANERDFLYAGRGKGAAVAAWQQATRAEAAAANEASHAQLLLDLAKAFERVPHDLLVQEARAVGYPLPLLRLSLAAYALPRTVAIGGTYSSLVTATRGITAGSGTATTELRVLLLRLLDRIAKKYPSLLMSVYVDDVSAQTTNTEKGVQAIMQQAGTDLARGLQALRLELSATKCSCTASTARLGHAVAHSLRQFGVTFSTTVKSLGVGMASGVRRNVAVQRARTEAFRGRVAKFKRLAHAKANAARIIRSGGSAAMAFGDGITGVSSSVLLARRRLVAAAVAAPAKGRDLDITLTLADDTDKQEADPAFNAHAAPITMWSEAVWKSWCPTAMLSLAFKRARLALSAARRPWAVVRGPAAATLASVERLGWIMPNVTTFVTDRGRVLDLNADPPIVVQREVHDAVSRWRWRRIEAAHPHLHSGGEGRGALLAPVQRLLRTSATTEQWTKEHQGALRSAVTGSQWPQTRLCTAQLAPDPFCKICEAAAITHSSNPRALCAEPPRGTLPHRHFSCRPTRHAHDTLFPFAAADAQAIRTTARRRLDLAELNDDTILADTHFDALGNSVHHADRTPASRRSPFSGLQCVATAANAWTRCLFPPPPAPPVPPIPDDGTFHWTIEPVAGLLNAVFYTDGSIIDGPDSDLLRVGWAFVAVDPAGRTIAAAHGVAPPWVRDIGTAEAWALYKVAAHAAPDAAFRTDSLNCVTALRRGKDWAIGPMRPSARVWKCFFRDIPVIDPNAFVWIPAHCSAAAIGTRKLGDGSTMTHTDWSANRHADLLAKKAALEFRSTEAVRAAIAATRNDVTLLAEYIGRTTWVANNHQGDVKRDSTPTVATLANLPPPTAARAARRPGPSTVIRDARPIQCGGHRLHHTASGKWQCSLCRCSASKWNGIATRRCGGSAAARWASRAADLFLDAASSRPHRRFMSDDVVWCDACGAYADAFSVCLSKPCIGRPSCPGKSAHLHSLRSGRHPRTGIIFRSAPVPEPRPDAPLHPHYAGRPCPHPHREWGSCGSAPPRSMKRSDPGAARAKMDALRLRRALSPAPAHGSYSAASSARLSPYPLSLGSSFMPLPCVPPTPLDESQHTPATKRRRITGKTSLPVEPSMQLATTAAQSPADTLITTIAPILVHGHERRRHDAEHHMLGSASSAPDLLPPEAQGLKRRRIVGKRQPVATAFAIRDSPSTAASCSTARPGPAPPLTDASPADATIAWRQPPATVSTPVPAGATDLSTEPPPTRKQLIARLSSEVALRCNPVKRHRRRES